MLNQITPSDGQSHDRLDMDLLTDDRSRYLVKYLDENVFFNPTVTIERLYADLNKLAGEIGRKIADEFQSSDSPEVCELLVEYRKVKREIDCRGIFKPVEQ